MPYIYIILYIYLFLEWESKCQIEHLYLNLRIMFI